MTFTALLSALLASFGTAVFDLAVTTILRPPGFEVLPYTINRQFQQGFYGLSTAATVLATMVVVTLILAVGQATRLLIGHRSTPPVEERP